MQCSFCTANSKILNTKVNSFCSPVIGFRSPQYQRETNGELSLLKCDVPHMEFFCSEHSSSVGIKFCLSSQSTIFCHIYVWCKLYVNGWLTFSGFSGPCKEYQLEYLPDTLRPSANSISVKFGFCLYGLNYVVSRRNCKNAKSCACGWIARMYL